MIWLSSSNCTVINIFPASAADGTPENVASKLSNNNQFGSLSLPASDTYTEYNIRNTKTHRKTKYILHI